jgi:hypothetical protein
VEDWLVKGEELAVHAAFGKLRALFVDCKVYDWRKVIYNVEAVLESNLQVILCCFFLHPAHVIDCVRIAEVEAIIVLLARLSTARIAICTARRGHSP